MARINIEDELFTDIKFIKLLSITGDYFKSVGIYVLGVKLAQAHHLKNNGIIPKKYFDSSVFGPLIESGFFSEEEEGFSYINRKTEFAWLDQSRENGKKGGRRKEPNPNLGVSPSYPMGKPLTLTLPLTLNTNTVVATKEKHEDKLDWLSNKPKEVNEIRSLIETNKLFGLQRYVSKICSFYKTSADFADFIDSILEKNKDKKEFSNGLDSIGARNLVTYIIKEDLGLINKKKEITNA